MELLSVYSAFKLISYLPKGLLAALFGILILKIFKGVKNSRTAF